MEKEPQEERQSKIRSILRPLGRLINPFRYDPVNAGYWPIGDGPDHNSGFAMSTYQGQGDRGMGGVLARIELNEEDGRPLDEGLSPNPLQPQ